MHITKMVAKATPHFWLHGSITYYRAVYGWYITTSEYTSDARAFAKASGRIRLLDGSELLSFIEIRRSELYSVWQQKQRGLAVL